MPPVPLVLLCLALCATALAHEGSAPQAASRAVRLAAQQVAHWRAALDPHGSVYYWSNLTRQSQWAPPGTQRGVGDGAPPARLVARGSGFAVIDGLLGAHAAAHVARDVDKIHRAGLLSAKQASRDCGNFGRILDTFAAAQELLGPDMRGLAPSLASHDLVHALLVLGGTAGTGELLPSLVAEDAAPLSLEATFMMVARYRGDGMPYAVHSDSAIDMRRGHNPRLLTLLYYLDASWHAGKGGQLRVHASLAASQAAGVTGVAVARDGMAVDIAPVADRLVLLRSDVLHEVTAVAAQRDMLSAWFYRG